MKKAQFGGELGQKLKSEISKSLKKKTQNLNLFFSKSKIYLIFIAFEYIKTIK